MVVLAPLVASSSLGATSMGFSVPTVHDRAPSAVAASPPLGASPQSRSHSLTVSASTLCPPRAGGRVNSGSGTRFAPLVTKSRLRRGRRGSGGSNDDGAWGEDDVFNSGPWDGFESLSFDGGDGSGGRGGRGGRGRYGGGGGGGGGSFGGGGWDRSNSEFGDQPWGPALAGGAAWVWQALCAASLVHSVFFLLFPANRAAQSAAAPFSPHTAAEGLC